MSIQSSEQINKRSMNKTADGRWTAARTWLVTGATSENDCLSAQALPNTPPIDAVGNSHPQCQLLIVKSHAISIVDGQFAWEVTANYEIPTGEASTNNSDVQLLAQKPTVTWGKGTYSQQADVTVDQAPIVNAAGDPYSPAASRGVIERHFRFTRWEPTFDIQKARQFEDHVNDRDMQLGPVVILHGECLCASIEPVSEYSLGFKTIQIAYDFVLRIDNRVSTSDGNTSSHPFQLHRVNQGRRGYWSDSGTIRLGDFSVKDSSAPTGYSTVSKDVLLDMTGKPLDSTIFVTSAGKTPVANPNITALKLKLSPLSQPNQVVLQYALVGEADFSQMGL